MSSVREALVRAVIARIAAAVSPAPVLRQPTVAQPREASPFVAVVVESDSLDAPVNLAVQRHLLLRIVAVSRDATDPWAQADDLMCRVHAALMAEPTMSGLALGIEPQDTDFEDADADAAAVSIPSVYRFTYRHSNGDLTQGA